MNKKIIFLIFAIVFNFAQIFYGCAGNTNSEKYDLIRIHIRADSNLYEAQDVKLKVRDSVTNYLTNELIGVIDYDTAYGMIGERLQNICLVANGTLAAYGFGYTAKARLNNEYFPTRSYDGFVAVSGFYDALIIELGSGEGDNWWCVIYPPLCYVSATSSADQTFKYKSWIQEILKNLKK